MERIFISYSRRDEAFARRLAGALSDAGADVWMDVENIPAGENWSNAIQQGLNKADLMLVILSPDSMESRNVEAEWQYFMDSGRPIIPVRWRECKVHFQLNRLQYVDFYQRDFHTAFSELVAELHLKGVHLSVPNDIEQTSVSLSDESLLTPGEAVQQVLKKHPLRFASIVVVPLLVALMILVLVESPLNPLPASDDTSDTLPEYSVTLVDSIRLYSRPGVGKSVLDAGGYDVTLTGQYFDSVNWRWLQMRNENDVTYWLPADNTRTADDGLISDNRFTDLPIVDYTVQATDARLPAEGNPHELIVAYTLPGGTETAILGRAQYNGVRWYRVQVLDSSSVIWVHEGAFNLPEANLEYIPQADT